MPFKTSRRMFSTKSLEGKRGGPFRQWDPVTIMVDVILEHRWRGGEMLELSDYGIYLMTTSTNIAVRKGY